MGSSSCRASYRPPGSCTVVVTEPRRLVPGAGPIDPATLPDPGPRGPSPWPECRPPGPSVVVTPRELPDPVDLLPAFRAEPFRFRFPDCPDFDGIVRPSP